MEPHPCSRLPDMPRTDRSQPMSTPVRSRTILKEVEPGQFIGTDVWTSSLPRSNCNP